MFNFIKRQLQKIYTGFTGKLAVFFGKATIDEATLRELELLLISSDTGVTTTRAIIDRLKTRSIADGAQLRIALEEQLQAILHSVEQAHVSEKSVYLLVGINGSGKTTFVAKLAHYLQAQDKKVLLVAADTFRAAAPEQLSVWAERLGVDIVCGAQGQDPAAVVFSGCERFNRGGYDALIIDTAGRLQTKTNLMNELAKIRRVMSKVLVDTPVATLLTIDAMLGQNSFEQARIFKEAAPLDGIVLTKMDGTGKGGIVFAIADQLGIPVAFITFGEAIEDLKKFDAQQFVHDLLHM